MTTTGPIIHVLGTVGSGKGTQISLLTTKYGIPGVSAGDLFRAAAAEPTELGRRVDSILRSGALMPIDLWDEVVRRYLERANFARGYLLDTVVRTLEQVEHFDRFCRERTFPQPWALVITLTDEVAFERIRLRGRADTDTVVATRKRLEWSKTQVGPVIEHYRSLGRVVEVNGDQPIEAVHRAIVLALTAVGALPKALHA